jgi:hypothetical protein
MSAHLNCVCGAPLQADSDQPVDAGVCPACGRPHSAPSTRKGRRWWRWLAVGMVVVAGLVSVGVPAVESIREASARTQ